MALKNTFKIQDAFGERSFSDAYTKVEAISGGKDNLVVFARTRTQPGGACLHETRVQFVPDLGGNNFIKQAYTHLKLRDEFANAEDC
jgi:hypothetical protein